MVVPDLVHARRVAARFLKSGARSRYRRRALVAEATAQITTYSVEQVRERLGTDPRLQLVDIRDVRELERDDTVPGALHAPRGMLEFWVDPESPHQSRTLRA